MGPLWDPSPPPGDQKGRFYCSNTYNSMFGPKIARGSEKSKVQFDIQKPTLSPHPPPPGGPPGPSKAPPRAPGEPSLSFLLSSLCLFALFSLLPARAEPGLHVSSWLALAAAPQESSDEREKERKREREKERKREREKERKRERETVRKRGALVA